ncbi:hypothetical protein AAG570_001644 [Ranatra chinensis]|uniref:Uncharacterized protein n=1 Tax=Ranatra chinensis TaxID=642074 RepID=A0ABD0YB27_9HEMI
MSRDQRLFSLRGGFKGWVWEVSGYIQDNAEVVRYWKYRILSEHILSVSIGFSTDCTTAGDYSEEPMRLNSYPGPSSSAVDPKLVSSSGVICGLNVFAHFGQNRFGSTNWQQETVDPVETLKRVVAEECVMTIVAISGLISQPGESSGFHEDPGCAYQFKRQKGMCYMKLDFGRVRIPGNCSSYIQIEGQKICGNELSNTSKVLLGSKLNCRDKSYDRNSTAEGGDETGSVRRNQIERRHTLAD